MFAQSIFCKYLQVACPSPSSSVELVNRLGIKYLKYSDTPFTGKNIKNDDPKPGWKIVEVYKNGMLEHALYFHQNSNLVAEMSFKNGKKHGIWKAYSEDGNLSAQESYVEGIKHGKWLAYSENGNLFLKQTYKMGKSDGKWERYYENGNLDTAGNYVNGKQDGEWISLYKNGKLNYKRSFKMGVQEDGFYYSYYPNGQVASKGFIDNGLNQGVYTRYYEDGTLQRIIDSYRDGKKWGYEEWFYPSEKLKVDVNIRMTNYMVYQKVLINLVI